MPWGSRGSTKTFDQELLNDGLLVSFVGMGIVFVVLVSLALTIKVLSMMDRESAPVPAVSLATFPATPGNSPRQPTQGGVTGQQVAAIAVALALTEKQDRSPARPSSGSGVGLKDSGNTGSPGGSWLQSGRTRLLGSNRPPAPSTRSKRSH
ncbi:MAG: OadG family protein [Chloroflexi bacterium]|nr:OadG family protein [Chloroflexota bacterium]